MKLTRRSVVFLVVAAVLLVLNLARFEPPAAEALPVLPQAVPDQIVRVQIYTPIEKLRMERVATQKGQPGFDDWKIVTPLDFPADAAQIRTILRTFGPGLPMEAFVDDGNYEDYGVDDQNGRLVELFKAGDDVPVVSVWVGKTAAGPSTFVRIPDTPNVYRADVGGLARYARPAAEWRDKMALDVTREQVVGLTLTRGAEVLKFTRGASTGTNEKGEPLPGHWELPNAPFSVDDDMVDATIKLLAKVRAGEIHNRDYAAGFDASPGSAALTLEDGTVRTITLGSASDDKSALIRVDGRDDVFRVSAAVGRAILQPLETFRDRLLLSFAVEDVASIAYVDRGLTVVLSQADDGSAWTVTQPANMDADQKLAIQTVTALSKLRAAGIPADSRFEASGARLEARFRDGRTSALEIGQSERDADNRPLVRVRVAGKPAVYQLRETTLQELRAAFGR